MSLPPNPNRCSQTALLGRKAFLCSCSAEACCKICLKIIMSYISLWETALHGGKTRDGARFDVVLGSVSQILTFRER